MRYVIYGLLMIPAAILGAIIVHAIRRWIKHGYRFSFHKTPQEKEESIRKSKEAWAKYEEELLNPDFPGLEELWGHPFPASLKAFYEDKEKIVQGDFWVTLADQRLMVEEVIPATTENQHYPGNAIVLQPENLWSLGYFAFAYGCDAWFVIDPRLEDPEVILIEAFASGRKEGPQALGIRLSTFLSSLKKKDE
jgi:hypothetical protein